MLRSYLFKALLLICIAIFIISGCGRLLDRRQQAVVTIAGGDLEAIPGWVGTRLYTVVIDPPVNTATLTLRGTHATFAGGVLSRVLSNGQTFTLDGTIQGFDTLTITGAGIKDTTLPVIVRDTSFEIDAQCAVRNCPCTDCEGTADHQDGAFMSLSNMMGGFMWHVSVLPHTLGRNGLAPDWSLHTNSRAYSRGSWFGTTPATLECFERIRLDGAKYIYQEKEVREYVFDLRPEPGTPPGGDPKSPEGATAKARYEVMRDDGSEIVIRRRDGTRLTFFGLDNSYTAGALKTIRNRFGDTIVLAYNNLGQLETLSDVYGRQWTFTYDSRGRLIQIKEDEHTLRTRFVKFSYDPHNRLIRIDTTPVITDGGIGNQFPRGKPYVLGYPAATGDFRFDTNIVTVTYPNEVLDGSLTPRIRNVYGGADRVLSQAWGGMNASGVRAGGTLTYTYNDDTSTTTVNDRNGNRTIYTFNALGLATRVAELTNRSIRAGDPAAFVTHRVYNDDEEVTALTRPLTNQVRHTFDTKNPNRFAHGNLLEERRIADAARGGAGLGNPINDIVRKYTYEPIFQGMRTDTAARGTDEDFIPPNTNPDVLDIDFNQDGTPDGNLARSRYTTFTIYDYQEADPANIHALAAAEGIHLASGQAAALALNTDLNLDGVTNQRVGLPIRVRSPTTVLANGGTQDIISDFRYNAFGLLIATIDAEGYLDEMRYGPSGRPDGTTASTTTGGYLLETVQDFSTAIRTPTQNAKRTRIKTRTERDPAGNIIVRIDGRGIRHTLVVNERNQTQKALRAADTSNLNTEEPLPLSVLGYETILRYDGNDNLVETEVENNVPASAGHPTGGGVTNKYYATRTFYDILDNPVKTEEEVQKPGETVTILGKRFRINVPSSSDIIESRLRYDRNENPVLVQTPISVRAGDQANNVSSTIFDERDLPFKRTEGGVDPSFAAKGAHADVGLPPGVTTDALTLTVRTNYDGNENVIEYIDAEDNGAPGEDTTTMIYDGFDRIVQIRDAFGNDEVTTYDPDSQVFIRQSFGPDGGNKPATPANRKRLSETRRFYDELGRVFRKESDFFKLPGTTAEQVYTTTMLFDRNARMVQYIDARGNPTRMAYDGADRLVVTTDAAGNTVEEKYDDNSNVIQIMEKETEGGRNEIFYTDIFYDAANRAILSVDNFLNAQRRFYDSRGNLVAHTDANASATTSIRLRRPGGTNFTINTDGNRVFTIHDGLGRRIEQRRELRIGHDGSNRIDTSSAANPDGIITTKTDYDDNSRVVAETDDRHNTTRYSYDTLDRTTREIFADGTTRTWRFDRDSHVVQWTDQRGVVGSIDKHRDIDALGRVLKKTFTLVPGVAGTTLQTFEYDGLSRTTKMFDNNGKKRDDDSTVLCSFDSLSRCFREIQVLGEDSGRIDLAFDQESNMTRLTYPSGFGEGRRKVTYGYDVLNRINVVEEGAGVTQGNGNIAPTADGSDDIVEYTFVGPGRIRERRYLPAGANMRTSYSYDAIRRIIAITHTGLQQLADNTAVPLRFTYGYDRQHNVLFEQAAHEATGQGLDLYRFDSVYRLTQESRDVTGVPSPPNNDALNPENPINFFDERTWTLDGVSNWRTLSEGSPQNKVDTVRPVNPVNEYIAVGKVHRLHDTNGNLIDDGTNTYTYDALNRLVRTVRNADGLTIGRHAWDAKDRRVRHIVADGRNDENLRFFYARSHIIEEHDGNLQPVRQFVMGNRDERIQILHNFGLGTNFYFEKLGGSIAAFSDAFNFLVKYFDYQAYGQVQEFQFGDGTAFDGNDARTMVTDALGHYFSAGMRLDLETGHYLIGGMHYDPFNGRGINEVGRLYTVGLSIFPGGTLPPSFSSGISGGPLILKYRFYTADQNRRGRLGFKDKWEDAIKWWVKRYNEECAKKSAKYPKIDGTRDLGDIVNKEAYKRGAKRAEQRAAKADPQYKDKIYFGSIESRVAVKKGQGNYVVGRDELEKFVSKDYVPSHRVFHIGLFKSVYQKVKKRERDSTQGGSTDGIHYTGTNFSAVKASADRKGRLHEMGHLFGLPDYKYDEKRKRPKGGPGGIMRKRQDVGYGDPKVWENDWCERIVDHLLTDNLTR